MSETSPLALPVVGWDPTHNPSFPRTYWSTSNFGEAMPGVVTPLTWSVWGPGAERSLREAFYRMGALTRRELAQIERFAAEPQKRTLNAFFGRVAGNVDHFATMGDRLPGTSGAAIVEQLLGKVPPGLVSRATRRRYPVVAVRFPVTFARIAGELHRARASADAWWSEGIQLTPALSEARAAAQLRECARRFSDNVTLQGVHGLCSLQPVYEQLTRLVARAGMGDANAFMSGYGSHEESAVVADLWSAAHGELEFAEVVRRHGYHGPNEGEMSATVWREDPSPLRRLLAGYAGRPPVAAAEEALRAERIRRERELLAALPATRRGFGRLVLRLVRHSVPLRGVGKAAFLQSLDMGRAAARRLGELMVLDGALDDRDDAFFLTVAELASARPADPRDLVARRRERFRMFGELELPPAWQGDPVPEPALGRASGAERVDALRGVGVSPGVVEGRVRVVLDPVGAEVEPDEILVAPTTDPSWAAIMFVSKALIVDIGGALSHAAIVARELAVPCVVNTQNGSRVLRTGDVCRVDGGSGEVTVLHRAARPEELQRSPVI